jgi:two-component system, cell cycle sensor histidine kinase and response regulator CckA
VKVLVVEDDPAIRHVIDVALSRRGHSVLTSATADEAAALLLDFPDRPDLAILDVMLPGITGVAYGEDLARQFPGIRIVFMTGWLDRPERHLAEQRGYLLPKPFSLPTLLAAIAAA